MTMLERVIQKAIERGWKADWGEIQNEQLYQWADYRVFEISSFGFRPTDIIFNHDFAKALWGEEKKEWLGKFVWVSSYEQDSYIFDNGLDLLNSWVFRGGSEKPTLETLENLPEAGINECAGVVLKRIEITNKGWQYHLKQMIVADDPIRYVWENI